MPVKFVPVGLYLEFVHTLLELVQLGLQVADVLVFLEAVVVCLEGGHLVLYLGIYGEELAVEHRRLGQLVHLFGQRPLYLVEVAEEGRHFGLQLGQPHLYRPEGPFDLSIVHRKYLD